VATPEDQFAGDFVANLIKIEHSQSDSVSALKRQREFVKEQLGASFLPWGQFRVFLWRSRFFDKLLH